MGIKRKLNRTGGAMRAAENEVSSFFSTTSINGFGRIKSSKLLLTKGLWVGIIVTSIVLCTLVINQNFVRWRENPVTTTVGATNTMDPRVPNMAITVCPGNTLSYDPWAAVESLLGGVRLSCGSTEGSQEEDGAGCQEWADGGARETFRFFLKALAGDTFQRIYESLESESLEELREDYLPGDGDGVGYYFAVGEEGARTEHFDEVSLGEEGDDISRKLVNELEKLLSSYSQVEVGAAVMSAAAENFALVREWDQLVKRFFLPALEKFRSRAEVASGRELERLKRWITHEPKRTAMRILATLKLMNVDIDLDLGRLLALSAHMSEGIFQNPYLWPSDTDYFLKDLFSNITRDNFHSCSSIRLTLTLKKYPRALSKSESGEEESLGIPISDIPVLLSAFPLAAGGGGFTTPSKEEDATYWKSTAFYTDENSFRSTDTGCSGSAFEVLMLSMIRFSSELTLSMGGLEDVLKRHPCGGVKSNPCCSYLGRIFARHLRLVFRIMGLSAPATRRKMRKSEQKILETMRKKATKQWLTPNVSKFQLELTDGINNRLVLVPFCGLDGGGGASTSHECSSMRPFLTDLGLCMVDGGPRMEDIYVDTTYMETFSDVFVPSRDKDEEPPNGGEESQRSTRFRQRNYIFDNSMSHRPALSRKMVKETPRYREVSVSFNDERNPFSAREKRVRVRPGYHTFVRVVFNLRTTSEDLRRSSVEMRKCRLPGEVEGMEVLKTYTENGCHFECSLSVARNICGCTPWNYPHPPGNITEICDVTGNTCFEKVLHETSLSQGVGNCSCLPECDLMDVTFYEYVVPMDAAEICSREGSILRELCKAKAAYEVRPELKEGECGVSACRAMLSTDIGLLTVNLGSNVVANINSDISSTFAQKLSLVGGTMGLFAGISIISLVEAFYCLTVLAFRVAAELVKTPK